MADCVIIEDSDRVRDIAVSLVEGFGLSVLSAAEPKRGAKLVKDKDPKVVLLDWDLPKLGALDVMSSLAETGHLHKPKVILMAAENEPKQFALARAAGATHYVLKPFDADDLADVFEKAGIAITR